MLVPLGMVSLYPPALTGYQLIIMGMVKKTHMTGKMFWEALRFI